MTAFIKVNGGFVNADEIRKISSDGDWVYGKKEGVSYEVHGNALETIVEIVPSSGEWEVVLPSVMLDEEDRCWSLPLIGWGRTLEGPLVPITPFHRQGVHGQRWGVRKEGALEVHAADGSYDDVNDFLDVEG